MTLKGRLEEQFFGGSVWVLKAEDGSQYQLEGKIPKSLDGKRVKVDGQRSKSDFSLSMVGESIEVRRISQI